jgi:hypothetical protein
MRYVIYSIVSETLTMKCQGGLVRIRNAPYAYATLPSLYLDFIDTCSWNNKFQKWE